MGFQNWTVARTNRTKEPSPCSSVFSCLYPHGGVWLTPHRVPCVSAPDGKWNTLFSLRPLSSPQTVHPSSCSAWWHASSVAAYLLAADELCRQISHHHFLFRRHGDENYVFRPRSEARKLSLLLPRREVWQAERAMSAVWRGPNLFQISHLEQWRRKETQKMLTAANLRNLLRSENVSIPLNNILWQVSNALQSNARMTQSLTIKGFQNKMTTLETIQSKVQTTLSWPWPWFG